ncbi:MAG: hypothetical protein Q9M19_06190, partial [Mariprofundaceae bacterium]|nr:hypothetical protein [Mariprofundaceae bacterium]
MKKTILIVSALLVGMFATSAVAEEGRGSVGLGTYAISMVPSTGTSVDFVGFAYVADYDVTDFISVGGHYYFTKFNTSNSVGSFSYDLDGFDVLVKTGQNGLGFTYYGGLGFYSETLDGSAIFFNGTTDALSKDYSGTLLGYGIGYNWDNVTVGWEGSIRSTGDYEKGSSGSVVAATGA